jgi:hypothetical protein
MERIEWLKEKLQIFMTETKLMQTGEDVRTEKQLKNINVKNTDRFIS